MEDFYFCAHCEAELENPDISMMYDGIEQLCEECDEAEGVRRLEAQARRRERMR